MGNLKPLYHSHHGGQIGTTGRGVLEDITDCHWCVVGWEDAFDPQREMQYHFEDKHPEINRNMWLELEERERK